MVQWWGLLDLTAKGRVQFLVGDLNSNPLPKKSFIKQIGFEGLLCMTHCWRYCGHNTDNIVEKKSVNSQSYRKSIFSIHWKDWCWSWSANSLATWCKELTHWKKNPDAGKDWRQKEKKVTEDEMVGWHQWFNRYEFQQTPGDSEGQGSLECCSPRSWRVGHDLRGRTARE